MIFNIGDLVTRKSYNNDIIFKIASLDGNMVNLIGINMRILADSNVNDLVKVEDSNDDFDTEVIRSLDRNIELSRDEYFYIPGKVLHIDSDNNYLERCMNLYNKMNVNAYGVLLDEDKASKVIYSYMKELNPDILVITGHDFLLKNSSDKSDLKNYKNTENFINTIKAARKYESNQSNLIIIAGACQSFYEELLKAGANFASSPKRVNIHALDPAIIAISVAFSNRNKPINIQEIISKTKNKENGFGGIVTHGMMYVGYPR